MKYRCNESLVYGGKHRNAGDEIELTAEEIKSFGASISPVGAPKVDAPKSDSDKPSNTSDKK